jgi:archaellum component FlaC
MVAKKKITKNKGDKFDMLARLIKSESDDIRDVMDKRFAKVDQQFAKVDQQFIKADVQFAKIEENFHEIRQELRSVRTELSYINRRLDHLEEQYGNIKGYSKEIDELRARVKDIEKHLKTARIT